MSAHESMEHAEHAEHASGSNKKIALLIAVLALFLAISETLALDLSGSRIGVSVLCPMVVETKLVSNSERIRGADYGLSSTPDVTGALGPLPAQDDSLGVEDVARLTADGQRPLRD